MTNHAPPDSSYDSRERKMAEAKLAEQFIRIFRNKVNQLQMRTNSESFRLEEQEREILLQVNNVGLMQGVAAGVLTLVLLRRTRASFLRRLAAAKSSSTTNVPHVPNSPFQTGAQGPLPGIKQPGPFSFHTLFGWFLDTTVSVSVGATVSVMFTDVTKILDKLSTVPLVSGRSVVAEEFCPDIIAELQKIRQSQDATIMNDPHSRYLKAIVQFGENCQRRAAYEKRLRRERGLSDASPVSIPEPGVPEDLVLTSDEEGAGSAWGGSGDFYDPTGGGEQDEFNLDFVETFVTDQEDEQDRKK